ncbi:MAG: hypothetical protein RIR48_331 [Bacteroidota bacterium]
MNNHKNYLILICTLFSLVMGIAQESHDISLNGKWSFRVDPYGKGEKEGWFKNSVSNTIWDSMAVPGNWDLRNEYADYAGDAWYSRTFFIEKSLATSQIRIVFESVYNNSKIWINGQPVGENHLGFLPFHFDISQHLKFGEENRITVLVNNVFKRGALWNWGGIRRPILLEITQPARLEFQHINAVPDLVSGEAKITTKIICSNSGDVPKSVKIGVQINREGKLVAKNFIETTIPANTKRHTVNWSHHLSKSQVALWHFDYPNLYESNITLYDGEKMLHKVSDRFGIRKLEIDGMKILLNGESIRPVGFNLVPEDRFSGNTLPLERIKEDVDLMKSCGANFARLSHVSLPKEFLDYLDQRGIMVFEEVGLWGKDELVDPEKELPKEWLRRIIEEKYNHPCVVGWSVGNEIGNEENNPKVKAYVKGAIEMAKQLDPNRWAVYVSNTAQRSAEDAVMYADITMVNVYGGWGKGIDQAWVNHKKPVFVSEFGDALNSEDPNLGIIPIEKMLNQMRQKEYVLGASLWTFNDYRSTYYGQPGWITPPSQNRPWGIVTTFREKKRSFYAVQKEYAPVKSLTFSAFDKAKGNVTLTIEPRGKLDIPSNVLRGYKLRLIGVNQDFDTIHAQYLTLKEIYPGTETFSMQTELKSKAEMNQLSVELIDPQGYSVMQETKYFSVPKQPSIHFYNTANNGVRLYFQKSKDATEYIVRYQKGDSIFTTGRTINDFIDIDNSRVKQGEVWRYQLVAVNAEGESMPSKPLELEKDEDELPPMIWANKRVDDDIFIAYSVNPYDYLYEIEYGSRAGIYTEKYTTKLKGVLNLKSVEKGEPFYYRMRVIKQWGFASEWTPEYKVFSH